MCWARCACRRCSARRESSCTRRPCAAVQRRERHPVHGAPVPPARAWRGMFGAASAPGKQRLWLCDECSHMQHTRRTALHRRRLGHWATMCRPSSTHEARQMGRLEADGTTVAYGPCCSGDHERDATKGVPASAATAIGEATRDMIRRPTRATTCICGTPTA